MTTRKAVTVNSNYHVAFGGARYSVPFTYANKSVEVVATKDTLAVGDDGQRIAMHQRVREGQSPWSTKQSHMPESHREFLTWNGERFRAEAAEVGPSCSEVMASMLTSHRVERQAHRSCKGADIARQNAWASHAGAGMREGAVIHEEPQLQDREVGDTDHHRR